MACGSSKGVHSAENGKREMISYYNPSATSASAFVFFFAANSNIQSGFPAL